MRTQGGGGSNLKHWTVPMEPEFQQLDGAIGTLSLTWDVYKLPFIRTTVIIGSYKLHWPPFSWPFHLAKLYLHTLYIPVIPT